MQPLQAERRQELIAQYHREAQQYRLAAAVTVPFRTRLAQTLRSLASRLESARVDVKSTSALPSSF
ncbi:hypothetical protein [Deinococcus hopiensis]|uniref:Uncharacterized protein n=1 Tax=Deinococcus hopiensis KR-140 TaxID=695939 RepID=A0A1W1VUD7_9DEIO|nr:hypothetical protein [Deinococcus hopiensis]SMB96883.1 hypothetical protein SAMN00790413_06183 [Deinococcus hopiensis KR-140]